MATLVLRFPGGRYHATPGGHHVNEGVIEWPPSPWRLVRALVACGYSTQRWEAIPPTARRLVEALSGHLPEYRLPRVALGHSRHYMPTTQMKHGREDTTLVLDAFADVGDEAIWVRWPTTLDDEAQTLFAALAANLGYLGRSESWVLGEAVGDDVPLPATGHAIPHTGDERPGRGFEQVALTAPEVPEAYASWRAREVDAAVGALGLSSQKKPTRAQWKKREAIEDLYPPDLVDCIERDTAWWKARKWSRAPGTRTVLYWREAQSLELSPPTARRPPGSPSVEMMLLALTTPSGSKSALPTLARTLPQAELLHRALISKLGFGSEPCPELVGRDANGVPMKGHRHVHLLPVDLDGDSRLDHIVLFAPMGLGAHAQRAVRSVRRTYTKGGVGELQLAVAGAGGVGDLRAVQIGTGKSVERLLGPVAGASTWISETPYVPPRHLKNSGRSTLAGQIAEELHGRGFPGATVDVLEWTSETLPLRHFIRRRQRGPQPPLDQGFAVRLHFDRPVHGPLCLGYGSHFGLGRFGAAASPKAAAPSSTVQVEPGAR